MNNRKKFGFHLQKEEAFDLWCRKRQQLKVVTETEDAAPNSPKLVQKQLIFGEEQTIAVAYYPHSATFFSQLVISQYTKFALEDTRIVYWLIAQLQQAFEQQLFSTLQGVNNYVQSLEQDGTVVNTIIKQDLGYGSLTFGKQRFAKISQRVVYEFALQKNLKIIQPEFSLFAEPIENILGTKPTKL